jgi:2-C-methyl-D-erythritol 4-phosphate cytidylyltransferase
MFVTAIIVAGGSGTRMGTELPKQFLKIGHKTIIETTIEIFNTCKEIDEIIVVINDKHMHYFNNNIDKKKPIYIVSGGENRQQSVYNALYNVNDKCEIVLIHDSVRPFVTHQNINDCIQGAIKYDGCTMGVKSKDTIKVCSNNNMIVNTLDRELLFCIQTPQAFKVDVIKLAHETAKEEDFLGTDDSVLLERLGYEVKVIEGEYSNIKITTKEDLK